MCRRHFKECQESTITLDQDQDLDEDQVECISLSVRIPHRQTIQQHHHHQQAIEPPIRKYQPSNLASFPTSGNLTIRPALPASPSPDRSAKYNPNMNPTFHSQMYALADKFDIKGMCEYVKEVYEATLGELLASGSNKSTFLESVPTVYNGTPESNKGLRSIVATYAQVWINELDSKLLREVILEVPLFAVDVLARFGQRRRNYYSDL